MDEPAVRSDASPDADPKAGRLWTAILRRLAMITFGLAAVVVVALVIVLALLRNETVRAVAARNLADLLSVPGERQVTIGHLGAGLPQNIDLADIRIADGRGVWVIIDRIEMQWVPWDLLRKRVLISRLDVRNVHLSRSPEPAATGEPSAEPSDWTLPSLPVAIAIEQFQIDPVQLESPVVGEAMRLRAAGSLNSTLAAGAETGLVVERTDGIGARLSARIAVAGDGGNIAVNIDGAEPAGGVISRLLDLPDAPALRVALVGNGPHDAWRGTLEADAEGVASLRAQLTSFREQNWRLRAVGGAEARSLSDTALRSLLSDRIFFELVAGPDPEGGWRVDRLAASTSALAAEASGWYDPQTATVAARASLLRLDAAALQAMVAPLSWSALTGDISVAGTLAAPRVDVRGAIQSLDLGPARWERLEWTGNAEAAAGSGPAEDRLAIALSGRAIGLNESAAAIEALLGREMQWSLRADVGEPDARLNVDIAGASLRVIGDATMARPEGTIEGHLKAEIADLARFASIAATPLAGKAKLEAAFEGTALDGPMAVTATLSASRLTTGEAAVDLLLGADPAANAKILYDGGAEVRLERMTVSGALVSGEASGSANLGAGTVSGRTVLETLDLRPLSTALSTPIRGRGRLEGSVSGAAADPDLEASVRVAAAEIAGVSVPSASVRLIAARVASAPSGRLTVQASTSTGEFTAQTTFASSGGGKLRFGDLRASAPGLQVTGEVLADLDGGLLDGAMDGRFAAPSPGIVVGDQRVTGQAQIALRLVPVGGRQRAEVTLDGAPFAMAAGDGTVVSVTAVRASATVADAFGAMTGEADVTVQDLRTDGLGLAVARLNASGNRARGSGTFSLRTDQAEPSELAGSVTWQVGEGRMVLAVTDLTGNLAGEAVLLGRPMEVQRLGEAITVAPVDLAIGEGRLGGQLTRAAGGTSLRLQVDRLPLAATRAFLPDAALSGRVDGNLELRPEGRLLGGTLDLRIADLGSGSQEGAEGLSLNVGTTAQLAAGRLALSGEARGLPGEPLVFSAAVPLAVDARTLTPLGDGAKAIDGRLTWQGPVRPIWEKFGPDNHLLEGVGKVDIGVGGTWAQPLVSGSIGLEDGAYQQFDLGTLIEDLDIDVDLRDTLAMTVAVRGNDGRQGRISAIGRGERDAQGSLAAEVSVDLEGAQLVRRDDVTATTSGSVTLQMQATGSRLEGRLEPKDVQVRLIEALPPSVVQLEVIEIGEPPHGRRQAPAKAAPSFETALAVTVNAPRRIFVRGRGLESEWSADLAVVGTAAAPRVTGAVKLVRGQFSFGGKRFALTEGVISFTGGERIDPSLRIAAEYRATDLTALIRVTGEASKPEIEITSTPALPREEILARVLFGRSAANLGPVEAVQLAAAIDGLARGQTVTTTGLDTVREFLGLDVLTWEAGETEDDAGGVAVGRYIGDRVYVGGKQTTEGATAGTVAIEIIPNVTLESEVDQKENRSLGLRWRWDY